MPWLERTFTHEYNSKHYAETGKSTVTTQNGKTITCTQNEYSKIFNAELCSIFDELGFTGYEKTSDYSINILGINYYFHIYDSNCYLRGLFDGCGNYTADSDLEKHCYLPRSSGTSSTTQVANKYGLKKTIEDGSYIVQYKIRVFCNTNHMLIQIIEPYTVGTDAEDTSYGALLFTFKGKLADGTNVTFISGSPNANCLDFGILKISDDPSSYFNTIGMSLNTKKSNILPTYYNTCQSWFPSTYNKENIVFLHPLNIYGGGVIIEDNIYEANSSTIPKTTTDYFFELNGEEYYRPRCSTGGTNIVLKL